MPHSPKYTPFYEKSLNRFKDTQWQQIQKGADKYPEPFNPSSWTADALLQHAMEEAVDLVHYLNGLHEKIKASEQEIRRLNDIIKDKDRNISLLIESQRSIGIPLKLVRKPSPFEELSKIPPHKPPYMDLDD